MSEPSDRPIIVSAEERAHPAFRKLARACIALARQLREAAAGTTSAPAATSNEAGRGQRHD